MAEKTGGNSDTPAAPNGAPGVDQPAPMLNIVGQYIRDLSFENPDGPGAILPGQPNPAFAININVQVKKHSDETYAVELTVNAKAEREKKVLFNVELVYGGLFRIKNVPDNQMPLMLMIECPRMLFPFARQILSSVTQMGGFPPMMMEPVDFVALYRQNVQRIAEQAKEQTSGNA
jgi:preprotein translocase subunit SecB